MKYKAGDRVKIWVDINKELPPVGKRVKIRCKNSVSYGELYRDDIDRLTWKISEIANSHLYYEIKYQDKEVHFWEKEEEFFIPIENRFEILDL